MKKINLILAALAATTSAALSSCSQGGISGKVSCDGQPVEGVCVSDGTSIVRTDARGRYKLKSDESDSLVFITTPGGYVAKAIDEIRPGFWQWVDGDPATAEKIDFELVREDQDDYRVVFITDCHFTHHPKREDFRRFEESALPVVREKAAEARERGAAVYSFNLGDFSHDLYWYDYGLNELEAEKYLCSAGYPAMVYSLSGNHDNDAAMAGSDESNDKPSAWCYRRTWGPDRYSVNIGSDHWIFLDNIIYINSGKPRAGHKNIHGSRNYSCRFTPSQFAWLEKDLSFVDPSSRVFLCCHCPVFNDRSKSERIDPSQLDTLDRIFSAFPHVDIFSGHSHKLRYTACEGYPRFSQYIISATSGNMWEAPLDCRNVGSDGSDQCIMVLDSGAQEPQLVCVDGDGVPMRLYDANAVGRYYRTDSDMQEIKKIAPARTFYGDAKWRNYVLANCWGMRPGDSVQMLQGGRVIPMERLKADDPLFVATYVRGKVKKNSKDHTKAELYAAKASDASSPVTVRIIREDGSVRFEKSLQRPGSFGKDYR